MEISAEVFSQARKDSGKILHRQHRKLSDLVKEPEAGDWDLLILKVLDEEEETGDKFFCKFSSLVCRVVDKRAIVKVHMQRIRRESIYTNFRKSRYAHVVQLLPVMSVFTLRIFGSV